ncbi:Magnesium transporter CorA-like family protein [Prunus dulcis]|uniref:Magnesium transporter CorA-like family protein n=1 Tax=Prunus dulcis TaxID=3755 RepID=A0A4Y1RXX5_PRUDU|nr:Magnesium transporter CorA-like family protein [Prunus dulcis]
MQNRVAALRLSGLLWTFMDLADEIPVNNREAEEMDREASAEAPLREPHLYRNQFGGMVRKKAYIFDGFGKFYNKEWDLTEGRGNEFCWYHVELPKGNQKLSQSAQYLIGVLCPPLKLQDILSLVSNGPFCGHVDGALVFRVNSPGPPSSDFTFRIAARITENAVITVSLGRVPRLGFSPVGQSLLSEIPSVESPSYHRGERKERSGIVIGEHVLEFLLTMNHSEEADNPVPKSVSNLVVHIVDTHVDHLQDVVTKLEIELDSVELQLDKDFHLISNKTSLFFSSSSVGLSPLPPSPPGYFEVWMVPLHHAESFDCGAVFVSIGSQPPWLGGFALKKQMLDDRRFPKIHLDLQRLLQVIAHGEQVFPRVKEKCSSKHWFSSEDIISLEELIGRLRRLKDNVGFIANRVTAIQAGLDSWQAEQINRKLYATSGAALLQLSFSVYPNSYLAQDKSHEEKLVPQQEIIPQENPWNWSSRKKGLPSDLRKAKHSQFNDRTQI